jgi:hypothetical protein
MLMGNNIQGNIVVLPRKLKLQNKHEYIAQFVVKDN